MLWLRVLVIVMPKQVSYFSDRSFLFKGNQPCCVHLVFFFYRRFSFSSRRAEQHYVNLVCLILALLGTD